MSESSVALVAQLNASWRVVAVSGEALGRRARRAWVVQQHNIEGEWQNVAVFRSSEMLRWFVQPRAGIVDEAAAVALDNLPARSDIGGPRPDPAIARKAAVARAAERRAAARAAAAARKAEERAAAAAAAAEKARTAAAAAGTRRARTAAAFLSWRSQKEEARS
jgi:hypothetical protein